MNPTLVPVFAKNRHIIPTPNMMVVHVVPILFATGLTNPIFLCLFIESIPAIMKQRGIAEYTYIPKRNRSLFQCQLQLSIPIGKSAILHI